jgi:hypothetical protein
VAVKNLEREERRKTEVLLKKRKERNKERNCPRKFVTGVKEKGKGLPENTVY